jgi:hypothetical protein
MVRPGERLVLIADEVDEALDLLYELVEADAQRSVCNTGGAETAGRLHVAA